MGRSGQLLRGELASAGLHGVYITNVVKCRPPDNRDPTPDELKACRPYLDEELATVKPEYVLTLGKPASKAVLKISKITRDRGKFVPKPAFMGLPTFHPAYVLRDPNHLPVFRSDLEKLKRAIDGETWDSEIEWELVTSETLRRFVAEFQQADEFSFDLETSGLFPFDPSRGTITSVNIGIGDKAWIIPMHMHGSPLKGSIEAQKRLMSMLFYLARGKTAVAHNGKFDNHWLFNKYGHRFYLDFDTMLAHHTLDENSPHDLEYLARNYLDVAEYDIPLSEKQNPSPHKLQEFYAYAGRDAVYTLRLYRIFQKKLREDKDVKALFYKLVMPAARAFSDIEQVGLTLDLDKFDQTGREIREERDRLEKELNRLVAEGLPDRKVRKLTNWNSPAQVGKVLFGQFKIPSVIKTPKGKPSTSEAAIIELKGKHPVVDALIAYRENAKFYSTYIEGFRELMIDDTLYISYKLHGTVTGRYSSRLHSIPRDGKIRNLAIAPEGWDFVQGDFSQAELRIAAELSGDLELRRCFAPGGPDVHWSTLLYTVESGASGEYVQPVIDTARVLSEGSGHRKRELRLPEAIEILRKTHHDTCVEIWKEWKEARKKAKAINFGFIYGMYPKKFIETCKLKYGFEPTFEEAEAFREAYFTLYRGIPAWHDRVKSLVHIDGFVRSLSGRIRRLPGIHSTDKSIRMEAERQAINSPVQGFIGDLKAMAAVEIHETVDRAWFKLVGEHHDALLAIAKRGEKRNAVLKQVKSIMRHPSILDKLGIQLTIPIEADLEIGPWGAGKKWEESDEQNKSITHQGS